MRRNSPSETPRRNLEEALKAILRVIKRQEIPYMVMGGMALSIWGRIRATYDVDVALAVEEARLPHLLKGLQSVHFLTAPPQAMRGHRLFVCRYLKSTKGLPVEVDLFVAKGDYQRQAIVRAVTVAIGREKIRVISPEDLILYKLLADRPIDRLDVQMILEEHKGRLDKRYLARWAQKLGISRALAVLSIQKG